MYHTLNVRHFFDASHQLTDSKDLVTKQCLKIHGHTFAVDVVDIKRQSSDKDKSGMVIDYSAIKNTIDILDHEHINDIFKEYKFEGQPTSENIAQFIWEELNKLDIYVREVRVCEGYKGEDRASWAIYTN